MNPPFPTKKGDEKEYNFVNHALKQMRDGNILFSVLPYATMVKKAGGRGFVYKMPSVYKFPNLFIKSS